MAGIAAPVLLAALGNPGVWHAASAAAPVSCSVAALVGAIAGANKSSAATLTLPRNCVYRLTRPDNQEDGGNGLPRITGDVTLLGNGSTVTRYGTASKPAPPFRFFEVAQGASLTLTALHLIGGRLPSTDRDGGAAIDNNGSLSVSNTSFANNTDPSSNGAAGGAIQNGEEGKLSISGSTFTGNTALEGGAIFNQGAASVTASTFSSNEATGYGGGALVNVSVSTSVVEATVTISRSTFMANTGPGGGAIDNDTTLTISDSTFSANTAGSNGGGAINNFGSASIVQTTFWGNSSPYGANLHTYCVAGAACSTTLSMSIVAGGQGGPNCSGTPTPPVVEGGYNLDDGGSCGFLASRGSLEYENPMLGPLQNNGGPTQTMALRPGSPAIDAIPPTTPGCRGSSDQRGVSRPQGTGCDIGAYEVTVP